MASLKAIKNRVHLKLKRRAHERRMSFKLSVGEVWRLSTSPCFYCASPPANKLGINLNRQRGFEHLRTSGIDRVNPQQGYVRGNVVSCCWNCNSIKGCMTMEEALWQVTRFQQGLMKLILHFVTSEKRSHYIAVSDAASGLEDVTTSLSSALASNLRERSKRDSACRPPSRSSSTQALTSKK